MLTKEQVEALVKRHWGSIPEGYFVVSRANVTPPPAPTGKKTQRHGTITRTWTISRRGECIDLGVTEASIERALKEYLEKASRLL